MTESGRHVSILELYRYGRRVNIMEDNIAIEKAGAVLQLILAVAFLVMSFKNEAKPKKKKKKKSK